MASPYRRGLIAICAASIVACAVAEAPAATAPSRITARDLGTLGGASSGASMINDLGQVAGGSSIDFSTGEFRRSHAFFWSASSGIVDIGVVNESGNSYPQDMNNVGQVVGDSETATDTGLVAFSWTRAGGIVNLGAGSQGHSSTAAVNDNGMIVGGNSEGDYEPHHAMIWLPSGRLIELRGLPGFEASDATAVNNHGVVVGWMSDFGYGSPHAFIWSRRHGMRPLLREARVSYPVAINENGAVAGVYEIRNSRSRGFVWTRRRGMTDLGTLGGRTARVSAINNHGQVVGTSPTGVRGVRHAFVWSRTTGIVDLGTLGGNTSSAWSINDSGWVVGTSQTGHALVTHAFLWTPETGMRDLGPAGKGSRGAVEINRSGGIAGGVQTGTGYHATLWQAR
jgi:probable HAF family extracellular repeat protein